MACFAAGGCDPVFDAVDETVEELLAPGVVDDVPFDVTGKPVVGLMPGGVSERGAGAALCPKAAAPADDIPKPLRRASRRRFALVETNPVAPAPEPGALV